MTMSRRKRSAACWRRSPYRCEKKNVIILAFIIRSPLECTLDRHRTSFHCIAFRLGPLKFGTGLFFIFLSFLEVCSLALGIVLSLGPFFLGLRGFFLDDSVLLDLFA